MYRNFLKITLILTATAISAAADNTPALPADVYALFKKVDSCSHNGSGYLETFDPEKFDAATELQTLKKNDLDAAGPDCSKGRIYSRSQSDGARLFKAHIKKNSNTRQCLKEVLTKEEFAQLGQLIGDATNVGVLASLYSGEKSAQCMYFIFEIYRADGVKMAFEFNYTE